MTISALPSYLAPASASLTSSHSSRTAQQPEIADYVSAGSASKDKVSLSSQGRLLSRMPPLFSEEIEADGVITLEELDQFFAAKAAEFGQEVTSRLNALGVDVSEPLKLTSDAEGQVRVAGDHPDKDKIEAMFAGDPELANRFRQLSGLASLLDAAKKHTQFAAEYAKNPQAAVANHPELFSNLPVITTLTLDDGGLSAQVSQGLATDEIS